MKRGIRIGTLFTTRGSFFDRQHKMDKMLRGSGAILALAVLSAGGANASERTRVEGAIPPVEGVVSPLRPEAVPEAGRELKLGIPAGGRTALHVTLPQRRFRCVARPRGQIGGCVHG